MSGHFTDEEEKRCQILKTKIDECGGDPLQFFQTAYFWRHQRHHDCVSDFGQYRLYCVIPKYVNEYLEVL